MQRQLIFNRKKNMITFGNELHSCFDNIIFKEIEKENLNQLQSIINNSFCIVILLQKGIDPNCTYYIKQRLDNILIV